SGCSAANTPLPLPPSETTMSPCSRRVRQTRGQSRLLFHRPCYVPRRTLVTEGADELDIARRRASSSFSCSVKPLVAGFGATGAAAAGGLAEELILPL